MKTITTTITVTYTITDETDDYSEPMNIERVTRDGVDLTDTNDFDDISNFSWPLITSNDCNLSLLLHVGAS